MLNNMIARKVIPPVIVAFLHSQGTRNEDLQPNAKFQQFIGADLVPWIRERYRIGKNAKLNVVAGSSFGGLAAAYTAFVHPEIFGTVLSQSGSFWWSPTYLEDVSPSPNAGWMVKQFAESNLEPLRFYMSVGSWESAGMLSGNRILRSVLMGKGNEVTYSEVVSGHNYANFQQSFPDGLIALLGDKAGENEVAAVGCSPLASAYLVNLLRMIKVFRLNFRGPREGSRRQTISNRPGFRMAANRRARSASLPNNECASVRLHEFNGYGAGYSGHRLDYAR